MSVRIQCELLKLNRSTWYHQFHKRPEITKKDKKLMDKIDEIYTKRPYYGTRRIKKELKKKGYKINRKRVQRLMRVMGIEAIYPKPKTSESNEQHKKYPYLLRNISIVRPNQVWTTDITYIRIQNDWLYLTAIMDWYSRCILSWRLSDRMTTEFCVEALEEALGKNIPEMHNSDQGSQFTSEEYISVLESHPEISISMDGRGRAFDNIFIERLWRTIKYEEVYLKDYCSPREARESLSKYIEFYNNERFHSSLNDLTPKEVYSGK
jgi:putative transposase